MLTFLTTSVVLHPEHRLRRLTYRRAAALAMTLPLLVLVFWSQGAMAQTDSLQDAPLDPPASVARLNLTEGAVSFAPASADRSAWSAAVRNRPLTSGDRLWTGAHARAELHAGSTAVRMDAQTSLDFLALNDKLIQLRLAQGSTQLRVRSLFDDQQLEVDTPNLAFVITQPGDYRLDVNPVNNTTRVVALAGGGVLYGDNGVMLNLGNQQQGSFSGTELTPAAPGAAVQDSFDAWAAARDRQEDQSISARYVPREILGYLQLDSYGDWQQDPSYGAVWLPRAMPVDWAPYRDGHWTWISPWGWTWVDDAPWGFAPFHYGRWAQIDRRWAWVPGHLQQRPIYAPALVAFIGGSGVSWSLAIGAGGASRPSVGWFPLAPGEAFRPTYRASPRYITQVNNNITVNNTVNINNYRYQHQPSAVTTLSRDAFAGGRNARQQQAVSATALSQARVLADRSALPPRPDARQQPRLAPAAALPPAALAVRPVVESRIGRSRDGLSHSEPLAPHTEQPQNNARSNPRPLATPAISSPATTLVMPPAAHMRPMPTPENNPAAAASHNRLPSQQPPSLPADQPHLPNALLHPREAQTRPNPTQQEPKEQRPLTDRSPQLNHPATAPAASGQAAAERAAADQSHRAQQQQQQQQLQQTEQARQQQMQQNRQSEAQQQQAAQIRQQNEELQAQRAQAQKQQEQARQQDIQRRQNEAQQQQRAAQIRQQNEELQAQRAQAQRQQELAHQQQQAVQQRKPAAPEPQNAQAHEATKEHVPGEVHRKPEP